MSTLIVNYDQLDGLITSAELLSNKLRSLIDNYDGIIAKLNEISTDRNNINEAVCFIRKKNEQLQEKKEKVDLFILNIKGFEAHAENVDKSLRDFINAGMRAPNKENKIASIRTVLGWQGVSTAVYFKYILDTSPINKLLDPYPKIKYTITDWYAIHSEKYIMDRSI